MGLLSSLNWQKHLQHASVKELQKSFCKNWLRWPQPKYFDDVFVRVYDRKNLRGIYFCWFNYSGSLLTSLFGQGWNRHGAGDRLKLAIREREREREWVWERKICKSVLTRKTILLEAGKSFIASCSLSLSLSLMLSLNRVERFFEACQRFTEKNWKHCRNAREGCMNLFTGCR